MLLMVVTVRRALTREQLLDELDIEGAVRLENVEIALHYRSLGRRVFNLHVKDSKIEDFILERRLWGRSILKQSSFENVDLRTCKIFKADVSQCIFKNCVFGDKYSGVFADSRFEEVRFEGCKFGKLSIANFALRDVTIGNASKKDRLSVRNYSLKDCKFSGTYKQVFLKIANSKM